MTAAAAAAAAAMKKNTKDLLENLLENLVNTPANSKQNLDLQCRWMMYLCLKIRMTTKSLSMVANKKAMRAKISQKKKKKIWVVSYQKKAQMNKNSIITSGVKATYTKEQCATETDIIIALKVKI